MNIKEKDHVTKGEFEAFKSKDFGLFRVEFNDFREEMRDFKGEMIDFKGEMLNFKEAVFELYEEQKIEYNRYMGALMEDNRSQTKMLVEAIHMQIERFDRKFLANDSEHNLFDRRLSVVEGSHL